ncbi:hypothetical protein O6H91_10G060500 [Diphasiastrum complanatum]|uniref:Uncharacterized protein n=1 Tax=Diphasiastrum complanatum TaxID=34168 RepID=A0ACC2CIH0_DIPCM|nr:hypothetical protein O6H91_10G060500 [Diphasiastrum complanatum]
MAKVPKHGAVNCQSCNVQLCFVKTRAFFESAYCEVCHEMNASRTRSALQEKEEQLKFLRGWDPSSMQPPHTDVVFQSSDGKFVQAHKAVLVGKSAVFKAMFSTQIMDYQNGLVKVDDMSYDELEKFIQFFYTAHLSSHDLEKHSIALLQAAGKYNIRALKSVCEEYLAKHVTKENVCSILELASKSDSRIMRDSILGLVLTFDFMKENSLSTVVKSFKIVSTFEGYKLYNEKHPLLVTQLFEALVERLPAELEDGRREEDNKRARF